MFFRRHKVIKFPICPKGRSITVRINKEDDEIKIVYCDDERLAADIETERQSITLDAVTEEMLSVLRSCAASNQIMAYAGQHHEAVKEIIKKYEAIQQQKGGI